LTHNEQNPPLFVGPRLLIRRLDFCEACGKRGLIVIVISKFLKFYSRARRTRAPAYSRAL